MAPCNADSTFPSPRPLFIPEVPKSVEFVRMRGKTDEKIVLTDLRFRVRARATQADRWRWWW